LALLSSGLGSLMADRDRGPRRAGGGSRSRRGRGCDAAGSLRRRERRESDRAGAACGAGGGGGTRRAEVRDRDRRAGRRGLAAAAEGCRVAAGPGGLSRARGDREPGEDLDRNALLSGVGTSKGPEAERDGGCRAHPRPAAAAVLQDRRSRDRAGIPNALGLARAVRVQAGAAGRAPEPSAAAGGDLASERLHVLGMRVARRGAR
jgi:hypothetical protein